MATTEGLMGLGVSAEEARRTGWTIVSVTTSAATQGSTGGLLRGAGNKIVLANVAGANGAVTLPADAGLGDEVRIFNTTATAGLVFPHSGGTIQNGTANQSFALPANGGAHLVKCTSGNWRAASIAAVVPS